MNSKRDLIILISFGLLLAGCSSTSPETSTNSEPPKPASVQEAPSPKSIFDQALKAAYDAAILTQTAKTVADWTKVQQGWKSAIDQLATIPDSSEQYEKAQQKIEEYQANLIYAEQKLASVEELVDASPTPIPRPPNTPKPPMPTPQNIIRRSSTGEWFVGGNLHNKTMKEWNRATRDNRLATAGDMTSSLLPHLATPALVKPYAEKLVTCIDETGKKDPNTSEQAEEAIENSSVAEIAYLCSVLMGW